ncbi:hypothetical protein ACFLV0_03670, partial [Chloroflexota bacterium]
MIFVRRLLEIGSAILMVGLMVLIVGCGSGSSSTPVSSSPAQTRPGPAAMLAFTTQPSKGIAGSDFNIQPVVVVEDAEGNLVNNFRGLLKLTITEGTGDPDARLYGGTTVGLTNSIVESKELSIDKAGVGYTLIASSGNLLPATSTPFTILPGEPFKLAFIVQPSGGKAGISLTPNPEITVQDFYGNMIANYEGSVTVSATVSFWDYTDPSQSEPSLQTFPTALSGTTTVPLVNGVGRFTDISSKLATFTEPGCRLIATSNSLKSATSTAFTILPAAPAKLEFTEQPFGCKAGIIFETQPYVVIEDIYGNVVHSSRASVTVSITPGSGPAGAILSGTNTHIAEDGYGGLATFTDLSIDLVGSGYTLTAATNGLPSATSQVFDVSAP